MSRTIAHAAPAPTREEADSAAALAGCAHRTTRDCECCGGWEQRCLDCGEHAD